MPARSFLLLAVLALAAHASAAPPHAAACADAVVVRGLGPSCPVEGGYAHPGGLPLATHGGDPLPVIVEDADLPLGPVASVASVACVAADQPRHRVLYVLPADAEDASTREGPLVRAAVLQANQIVHEAGAKLGASVRIKLACEEDGLPAVETVRLRLPRADLSFWGIVDDLRAQGFARADERYWIFLEAALDCRCSGISTIQADDRPGPDNANMRHASYSMVVLGNQDSRPGWVLGRVALHEIVHGWGGVQNSAPNASGGFHCNDGHDIMCYADGGSASRYEIKCTPRSTAAALAIPLDCGSDDYFHPRPPEGSYLATRWNVGGPNNRFLLRG